jgi:hypothetical protein
MIVECVKLTTPRRRRYDRLTRTEREHDVSPKQEVTPVSELRPYEAAIRDLKNRAELEKGSNSAFEIAAEVADKIETAKTIEEIVAAANSGPDSVEDLVGKPFYLAGYLGIRESSEENKEGGTGQYVTFHYITMDGERKVLTTGATNIVFMTHAFEKMGYFASEEWVSDRIFTVRNPGRYFTLDFA